MFAAFGPVMGLSAIGAPILAGALIAADLFGTGWRLVFLINVPVGILALATAVRVLPRTVTHPGVRLDRVGTMLVGLGLTGIIYPLIQGRADGWPAPIFAILAAGIALLVAFVLYERHGTQAALIELSLLQNRVYTSGIAVALAFFGAFTGLLLVVSLFCQLGEHFSPIHAGLTLVPMTVGLIIAMIISFAVVAKLGRHLIHIGIGLVGAGTIALALTASSAHNLTTWDLAPSLFVIGLGAGGSFGQLFDFVLSSVAIKEVGSASGVLNAVQQLANSIGVAVLGTVFFSSMTGASLPTNALAITAWVCLGPLALTFLLTFRLPMKPREESNH